jgi:hypothetical protein
MMSKAYRAEARVRSRGGNFGLSPENVRKIQVAAVQAVALYGAELWWDETKNHSRTTDLQKLVNRQSRSITGMLRNTPIGPLVKEAGLRSADSLLANRQRRYATRPLNYHTVIQLVMVFATHYIQYHYLRNCHDVPLKISTHSSLGRMW